MSTEITVKTKKSTAKIGDLVYGTIVLYGEAVYLKISKSTGMGVTLTSGKGYSIVCNLKTGTLREIPGHTDVEVLHVEMCCTIVDTLQGYLKGDKSCG